MMEATIVLSVTRMMNITSQLGLYITGTSENIKV